MQIHAHPIMRAATYFTRLPAAAVLALLLLTVSATAGREPGAAASSGLRLVMVEERGCRFCLKWNAEIAPGYPKSAEGRFAPLQRVRRGAPEIKDLAPVVYTPTFVVMRGGEELGRITGYPGADYFYGELRPILSAAGFFSAL
ncbi:MAG: thioredoxin [Hyphomicrobium sp.]|uniref:thioredoxin n=1 Tax=Hyphomicrobium sp. TaxID=82 RepID=UPI003D10E4BF